MRQKLLKFFKQFYRFINLRKKHIDFETLLHTLIQIKVKKYLEDKEKKTYAFFYFISFSYIHNWLQNPLIRAKKVFEKILKKEGEKRVEE